METSMKFKIGFTSTAIAIGCAAATYAFLRYQYRLREAAEALNYLKIRVVTKDKTCDEVVQELRKRIQLHRTLGFDCEWVQEHGKRKPVALVQLSSFDGFCGLFRLAQLKCIPQSLKDLLEDATVYKVGVACLDDARFLRLDYSVNPTSLLDIRHFVKLCGYEPGGLAALSKSQLRVVLDKSWRIRCSDWEADSLTSRQMNYAAADAHVAVKIFVKIVNELRYSRNITLVNKHDIWNHLDELCKKYVDFNFKNKIANMKPRKDVTMKEGKKKDMVVSKRYPHATRTKPLYHNCFLVAPDGEKLCTCDSKKAMWYVEKQLADVVSDDPLTVRLRFEPAGRSVGDVGRYYQLTKENKCVVCGGTNSYIRKNVVPREYRKYFPEVMKDHSSHDVVLLCSACHQLSNVLDQQVRERLAEQCDAPLSGRGEHSKYIEDQDNKKVRSAARALLYQSRKHVLPAARRQALEEVLLQHYSRRTPLTQDLLQEAAELQCVVENAEYESHGAQVVEYYVTRGGGLPRLEQMWREHFLTAMKPRHMPDLWSVTHNEERLRVRFNEGRLSEQDLKQIGLSKWLCIV